MALGMFFAGFSISLTALITSWKPSYATNVIEATIKIEVTEHPATVMLGNQWRIVDEFYWHKDFSRENIKVLMSIDTEKTNLKPLKMQRGKDYPMAWTNTKGKGRIFYTALGHREDVWTNPLFQKHLLGGIAWALGKDK